MNRSLSLVLLVTALSSLSAIGCSGGATGTGDDGTGNGSGLNAGTGDPTESGTVRAPDGTTTAGPTGTPCQGQGIKVLSGCTAPKGTYVAIDAPQERDAIANEMWTVMTNAQCWFKDGSSQQYVFYDNLQYTFWGIASDSKSFGTLQVQSVGRFEDKNAAVVTLRSESWLIVTLDAQTITLGKVLNGQPYIELYKAHNEGRCT